ncbi:MAG: site-2 protease family protein [Clostridium sp.]|nr:site-2 protease family protein [Clostridium sp.]
MIFDLLKTPELIIYWFMIFAFSISFHESAHAYVAYRMGDSTAKDQGRITLDPLKHLDLFGTIMILVSFIGWAKPVPINPGNFKNRKQGTILVSLAGPVSNLILALLFSLPLIFITYKFYPGAVNEVKGTLTPWFGASLDVRHIIFNFCSFGVFMNISLAIFNLLPIPPLDGSKILTGVLPSKYYFKIMEYHQISFVILIILSYTGWLGRIIFPVIVWVRNAIFFILELLIKLIV